jgi:hypothetical protein
MMDKTVEERMLKVIEAGVDQFGARQFRKFWRSW